MKRSAIDEQNKWRTEDVYADIKDFEADFSAIDADVSKISEFTGKLGNRQDCLNALRFYYGLAARFEKLYCYAALKSDEDLSDSVYSGLKERAVGLSVKLSTAASFIEPELSSLNPQALKEYIADPEFSEFDYMLKEIVRQKEHILSDKEERLMSLVSEPLGAFSSVFHKLDAVDLPLPKIKDEFGKRVQLTHGSYSYFLSLKDERVRRDAFKGMYGAFKSLINTIASLYGGNVKKGNFYAKARGYDSALAAALSSENIPVCVYENLIESVHAGLGNVHEYVEYRNSKLKGNQHMYDMYVPVTEGGELKMDFDEAFNTVLDGLKPLGEEYASLLNRAKNERWMDVYENDGKRSGAYMMPVYGVHPYVLLNHTETTHSVFTIAHELGHAMHTYYSQKTQPYAKSDYAIFVAEVASTVNEVLLLKRLISTAKDKEFKKYLLTYYLDMFRTTVYRQTMFAEFEAKAHEMDMRGEPLTPQALNDVYYELNRVYYGKGVIHDDEIKYEWARIPHFYTAFYVYKYATGLTSAVKIARGILEQGKPKFDMYKNFLSAGGSDSPYEVLKLAGVDLATKEPFEAAVKEFEETLKELKSLD